MSSILDLAISISLADRVSSGITKVIDNFKLLKNSSADAQKQMDTFKTMGFVGAAAGVAGGLAFKGVSDAIIGAVKPAMEFEAVMNNVKMAAFGKDLLDKSKAEEVKKTLNDLTTGFEKLGIATKFSDKQAAEAGLGMMRGGVAKDFILGSKDAKGNFTYSGLAAAMYSAQLGDIDPQASGDFIAKQKAAFNMNGDRTLQVVDYYSKIAAASTMDMKSLIPGMLTASGVAGQLGMSPEDTSLLVATTGTYTKDGGSAGTFTKDFLDRLIPHTKKQKEAMGDLGWMKGDGSSIFFDDTGTIKSLDFIHEKFQAAGKQFNPAQLESKFHAAFLEQGKNPALALATKSDVYSGIKGNVGNQLDMYQQVNIQMSGTKNMMESLGETWNIVKRVFGDPFLDPIKDAFTAFNKILGDTIIPWAKDHPEIIKVITAVALGASAFLAIGGAITLGAAAFGTLGTLLAGTGIGLGTIALISGGVIIGIAALVAAGYLIYKNWDKIAPFVKSVWEQVKAFTLSVWVAIGPQIVSTVMGIWGTIKGVFGVVRSYFQEIWPDIQRVVAIYWPIISTVIKFYLTYIWNNIKTIGSIIWSTMKAIWSGIAVVVEVAWTLIKDIVKIGWDLITGIIKVGLKLFQGDWSGAWDVIKSSAATLWTDVKTLFIDGWEGIKKIGSTWWETSKQWGSDIVDGISNGIKAQWDNLKNIVRELWDNFIHGPFAAKGEIKSPSRVMMQMGGYVTEGLALGIMDQVGLVKNASASMFDAIGTANGNVFNPTKPSGSSGIHVAQPTTAAGNGPVTIQFGDIIQQPGESADDLVDRIAQKVERIIGAKSQRARLTIGTRGLQSGY